MEEIFQIRLISPLRTDAHTCLFLLYKPLIGDEACSLYEVLAALGPCEMECSLFLDILQKTPGRFIQLRKKLEQAELLQTWQNSSGTTLLEVLPVRSYEELLNHTSLSRLLFSALDPAVLEEYNRILLPQPLPGGFYNISEHLQAADLEEGRWSEQQEEQYQAWLPSLSWMDISGFDWDAFMSKVPRSWPARIFTKTWKKEVASLASLYSQSEENMARLVVMHTPKDTWQTSFDRIRQALQTNSQIESSRPDDYSQPPLGFLASRQSRDARILPKERQAITALTEKNHLPNEVINTLIEHTLNSNQGAFSANYLSTLGNNASRLSLTDRAQTLEWLSRKPEMNYQRRNGLQQEAADSWYNDREFVGMSEQDEQRARELLERLEQMENA